MHEKNLPNIHKVIHISSDQCFDDKLHNVAIWTFGYVDNLK